MLVRNVVLTGGNGGATKGGGMYLDGCTLTMPSAPGSELRTVEIRGNEVLESGGGLAATGFSDITLTSELNRQVRISNNTAGTTGGGVYLLGSNLDAAGLKLEQNEAGGNGGAVTHTPGFLMGDVVGLPPPILHLSPASQNIDTCDDAPPSNPAFDIVGQLRVVNIPEVPNGAGALDRGAAEYQPPLFKDSFED